MSQKEWGTRNETERMRGRPDMNNKGRVVAVTVTFNRVETLKHTIAALESQSYPLEKIIIVDNGSKEENKKQLLELTRDKKNIEILWMQENLGGAGGFENGMRHAKQQYDPDWYWIMDDDAYPRKDTLERLLQHSDLDDIGCLAPLIWGVDWQQYQLYHHKRIRRYYTVDEAKFSDVEKMQSVECMDADAFVGPLFPKRVVEELGFPDGSMFIYGDDTEYTTRIRQKHNLYLIKDSVIDHNDPPVDSGGFSPKTYWKLYYTIRNKLLIAMRYNKGFGKVAAGVLLFGKVLWQLAYSILRRGIGRYRFVRIRLILRAFADGIGQRSGKTLDPVTYMKQFD